MKNDGLFRELEMTDSDEKLSYLLDEYSTEDGGPDLDEVLGDVNLQYRVRRYRMIGEVMRQELPAAIDTGFHASVMAKIRTEAVTPRSVPGYRSPLSSPRISIFDRVRLKPVAGLAVAAAVAVFTVVLWQPVKREAGQSGDTVANLDQQKVDQLVGEPPRGVVPVSTNLQPLGTRWKIDGDIPGLQEKLNNYLVNHTEYSNSVQGLIPQARVAGFDAQQ
jgi:negative regulator of sigma E activity